MNFGANSLTGRLLRVLLPLFLGALAGCQDAEPEKPTAEQQAAAAHERALAELQSLGAGIDVGENSLGRNGVKLDFRGTKLTDQGLERIKALNPILELYLNNTAITDAGLTHLTDLKQLQRLCLNGTGVTDAGLEHLTGLSDLEVLTLQDTKVTPTGVQKLQKALPKAKIFR
ncbi:MAG TPA: hypothetical protein VFA18_03410 [Gemmataceae bacterium]|nr:hypothetical protein [Gemmataceae bacterium]